MPFILAGQVDFKLMPVPDGVQAPKLGGYGLLVVKEQLGSTAAAVVSGTNADNDL